jgi:UDP-2-acetamido-3-amino-2,3-dideoxy-glucuronate N-acetyltransferase
MRIGLIGLGRWGKNWARVLSEAGVLGEVVDPDPLDDHICSLPADCRLRENIDQVQSVHDAFVVASPAATHASLACQMLERGYHVLVEKPMALSLYQAKGMVQIAEEARRALMVGHVLEHHPAFIKLEDLVKEGAAGQLRHISSRRMSFGRIRDDEDVIWSFAPHDIAMIQRLMGEVPIRVSSSAVRTLGRPLADSANIIMGFSGGRTAAIEVSWHSIVKEHRLVVTGSKGVIYWDDVAKTLQWSRGSIIKGALRHGTVADLQYGDSEPLANELKAFIEAIEKGSVDHCGARSGLAVVETLERIERKGS